jgi:hypothetical protein
MLMQGEPTGGNVTHAQMTTTPPLIAASKPSAAEENSAASISFIRSSWLSLLTFNFHLLTSFGAAIAAALPSAAVAILAARSPLPPTFNVQLLTFNSPPSRRLPAVSRPRIRHIYAGGKGKYSFPAIAFPSPFLYSRSPFSSSLIAQSSVLSLW